MKLLSFLLYLPAFFVFTILYGETEILTRSLEHRIANLETKGVSTLDKPLNQITPCAGPRVTGGIDTTLYADFIYWTARLDTLSYAEAGGTDLIKSLDGPLDDNLTAKKGNVKTLGWTWNPGFKAGLGWLYDHGCWDTTLQYTWFYTHATSKTNANDLTSRIFLTLEPKKIVSKEVEGENKAHASFYLHYQTGDLDLGRNYYLSRTLKMRPFIGLKGTWQKQNFTSFFNNLHNAEVTTPYQNLILKQNQSIWGIGGRSGVNSSWQFSKHISIYGNLALSALWLKYDLERTDTLADVIYLDRTLPKSEMEKEKVLNKKTYLNMQSKLHLVKPVIEVAFGLRGETYWGSDRYHVLVQAGWESQIWINQALYISNSLFLSSDTYNKHDLILHGLTGKIRFDF